MMISKLGLSSGSAVPSCYEVLEAKRNVDPPSVSDTGSRRLSEISDRGEVVSV